MVNPPAQPKLPVAECFAEVLQRTPDATAIMDHGRQVSYVQLDRQSEHLAAAIQRLQDAPEAPIFLLFEETPPAIAAMLACLKLGRPYVPLDPTMPAERRQLIRNDAQGRLIVSQRACQLLAEETACGTIPVLLIEDCREARPSFDPEVPEDTLAWILYTSGSTGTPKGVVQTQRNLLHYVAVYTEGQSLAASDRISLLSSYTANIASHDIFSALLNGATICPYSVPQLGVSPLAEWIEQTGISVFSCVPTLFRQFAQSLNTPRDFSSVRLVKLVGEPVYRRDFEAFINHFPASSKFVNRLGSSETGTIRWLFADAGTTFDGPNVPVGHAVRDNEINVLDVSGRLVPQGEVGEIVVRSRYLSPGYWNRPDLTAAAFEGDGPTRSFRTGDMGYLLPDGCLMHVGRKDSQIKIRGFRVEVAEVEAVLLDHPSISEVLVMLREDFEDDRRLVAYFVSDPADVRLTATQLREHVSARLAEYMVPNVFIKLGSFPLAPNGKIQRSALPPIGSDRPELDVSYVAPRTPLERTLAEISTQLLHLSEVGIYDDFFSLGGNSLLAMRMLSRIEDRFDIRLSVRELFEHPTIAGLAYCLLQRAEHSNGDSSETAGCGKGTGQ